MNQYTIQNTHEKLKERLFKYIETEYLGRNDSLRKAIKKDLEKKEVLWQEPFIEANPIYITQANGLTENDNIPNNIKHIFGELIDNQLGVYETPYKHQVQAVESFYDNKDLLVATGTGSGKTECFTWPMISSLVNEANCSPETWEKRGVRAIMLYPMNALVADQMGRLRNMIGDRSGKFHEFFNNYTGGVRIPQFGMYTGRTPYPGSHSQSKDKQLATTLRNDLLNKDIKVRNKLVKMGKYPAKMDLERFINNIENGNHETDKHDAEMVTRLEMQQNTPDILITNYSMLEYMLMRTEEASFWKDTKDWLSEDEKNKLLFIIDEAHMYKGAPGGEVALLIRRLMHRLELKSDKIQFILTSASIPEQKEAVEKFACDLTGRNVKSKSFNIITGETRKFTREREITARPERISEISIDRFQGDDKEVAEAIKEFGEIIGLDNKKCDFSSKESIQEWLYEELLEFEPLLKIINLIQGHAMKFSELAQKSFPNIDVEIAEKATNVILAVAPLAKNDDGQVLFPTRLHMMFRGLQGLYACTNPNCDNKDSDSTIPLGKIHLNTHDNTCSCGGKIYELINHRRCGALYLKAYINSKNSEIDFLWSKKGTLHKNEYQEIYLYVPEKNKGREIDRSTSSLWLNSITGKVEENDSYSEDSDYIRLLYSTEGLYGEDKYCPNCGIKGTLTDFSTKGNQSFYNLVSEQLKLQPQTIFDQEQLEYNPNGGRKVLLFSDSRQRAATLAKELTTAADEEALRKAIAKAAELVQKSEYQSMDYLYVKFLEVASESDLQFFYGNEEEKLKLEIEKFKTEVIRLQEKKKTGSKPTRERNRRRKIIKKSVEEELKQSFDQEAEMFSKYLLSFLSNQFRSLTDLGLSWIEPYDEDGFYSEIEKYIDDTGHETILVGDITKELYTAWVNQKIVDNLAFNHSTSSLVNKSLTRKYTRDIGVGEDRFFNRNFKKIFKILELTNIEIELLKSAFMSTLDHKTDGKDFNMFIRPDRVVLTYQPEHEWHKCQVCSKIFPFSINGICLQCFSEDSATIMTEQEYEGIAFLRDPIIDTINTNDKSAMRRINTEEHTAQLSHKDQMDKMWSTTEEYELLFQDVPIENKAPVDILSCTTTMEVGIDIGSLTAVGLRNIPPMRENYQQRAGRAGRRSSAISTILTFINNGPHDNYYFYNPERIISGEPRTPEIDVENTKLVKRHLNVVILSQFLRTNKTDVNTVNLEKFTNEYLDEFERYLSDLELSDLELSILIPNNIHLNFKTYKEELLFSLVNLKKDLRINELNYKNENGNTKTLLDVMLEEAMFPNYSFSRNVIGFTVEDNKGESIDQKPDRAIDIAISEYAPGRKIVIDKKTYLSGGIYNHYSKRRSMEAKNPAAAYFENASHYKKIYLCSNEYCNWNSNQDVNMEKCPFCLVGEIIEKDLLIPWGFAPENGENIEELKVDEQYSYANTPSYSSTIGSEDMNSNSAIKNLRYGRLIDQKLNIINTGPANKNFQVCRKCGAASALEDREKATNIPGRPYKGRFPMCQHDYKEVVIGAEFKTDMILLEIELDSKIIDTRMDGLWLRSAAQTLTEAIQLAASNLLDIDFNDINGGYRVRINGNKTFVDLYLFDSLSSGAGYCSMLENKISSLIEATYDSLDCPSGCATSCHDCLNHFGNQRVQQYLDRNLGKQLLKWCQHGELASKLSNAEQLNLIEPLRELAKNTNWLKIDKNKINYKGNKYEISVQPAMWNELNNKTESTIVLSDKQLVEALPIAYDDIKTRLNA